MSAPGVRGQARGPVLSRCCSRRGGMLGPGRGRAGPGWTSRGSCGARCGEEPVCGAGASPPCAGLEGLCWHSPREEPGLWLPGKPRYRGDPEAVPAGSPGP